MSQATTSRVKPLAWAGIFGAAILLVFAVIELVSPTQVGGKIVNATLFQIENMLTTFAFVGWVLICFAFYSSGAAGSGWLAKIALAIAVVGTIAASANSIIQAIAVKNFDLPDWATILFFGLVLFAPVLLGVGAVRARMVSLRQALYPIVVVGIVSMAFWGIFGDANPTIPVFVQGFAWIGFAFLAMAVKPKA